MEKLGGEVLEAESWTPFVEYSRINERFKKPKKKRNQKRMKQLEIYRWRVMPSAQQVTNNRK